jgi:formate dehydrogenase gamma subunit
MTSDAKVIPLIAKPLTGEQAAAMAQHAIKKHHVAIMLLHWFNATVWLLQLATGAALIRSPYFRVVPYWYIRTVRGMFGTKANMLRFHITLGVVWIAVFAVYGIFGYRTYLVRQVLQREIRLDRDDLLWLKTRVLNLLKRASHSLPPQGIYNAGQKLFALSVYTMIPIVMITGVVMSFRLISTTAVQWAMVLHFVAVGFVVSGLMIHVYMGAVFPEEKPAFFSMITGMVNELYAYRHHFKWWREVKMQEEAWEEKLGYAAKRPIPAVAAVAIETEQPPEVAISQSIGTHKASLGYRIFRAPTYWPPYVAGAGLGFTLLATFLLIGQGLGASGAFARSVGALVAWIAPSYAAHSASWSIYAASGQSPLINFVVFEMLGVLAGGFVSGWLAGRLKLTTEKGPHISARKRHVLALAGGVLTGLGARLARGCTSGLALSGGAVLSVGGFIFMLAVFGAGFAGAYLTRRYWL